MGHRRGVVVSAAIVVAALAGGLVAGCSQEIEGAPSGLDRLDPDSVAGLPVTEGPSGPRDGVPEADLDVDNADGSETDVLAINALADLEVFWTEHFRSDFDTEFEPLERYLSYDASGRPIRVCGTTTEDLVNAFFCPSEDVIAWDRGELLPLLDERFGPLSVVMVLAHEMGHAVQERLGIAEQSTPTIVSEQQADCFAGAFFRDVAEGDTEHFEMNTGEGLGDVLASVFFLRDAPGGVLVDENAHGTAFDRVAAFQFGFADGPPRCADIDLPEVQERATELGFKDGDDEDNEGNLDIDEDSVRLVERSLRAAFESSGATPPELVIADPEFADTECSDAQPTSPVSYCPATRTLSVDLDGLAEVGTPPRRGDADGTGDFAAFALLASRYVLAVQDSVGLEPADEQAGLRTACLVGAWAGVLLETPFGNRNPIDDPPLRIAAGDLDEAVSEMLDDGLVASDVNGRSVPSSFARVESFRIGFLEGSGPCT